MNVVKHDPYLYQIEYRVDTVNIGLYPMTRVEHEEDAVLTLGDMHGNAMKIFHALVKHQIFRDIDAQDYKEFVRLYEADVEEMDGDEMKSWLHDFDRLLNQIDVNIFPHLIFLGDNLCDRGNNDFLTLKLFEKLHEGGIKFDILLSNHDVIMCYAVQHGLDIDLLTSPDHRLNLRLKEVFRASLNHCIQLLDGLDDHELVISMEAIFRDKYMSHVKPVVYSVATGLERIALYSHSGCDLRVVQGLTQLFGVDYADGSIAELAKTIDGINIAFQETFRRDKDFYQNYVLAQAKIEDPIQAPIEYLCWNRFYGNLSRSPQQGSYQICYAHGHDAQDPTRDNIFNLDQFNSLGKTDASNLGELCVLVNHDKLA